MLTIKKKTGRVAGWMVVAVFLTFTGAARAQSSFTVRGKVSDSSGVVLAKATVRLSDGKDSFQVLSGEGGDFIFRGLIRRSFVVRVTMKGYGPYSQYFEAPAGADPFLVPPVILRPAYEELATVIVGRVHPLTIKGDTIQYAAAAYSMRAGSLLGDLIKKLPGVSMDADSGLMAMGKKVRKMMLDGKVFYGGDVQKALQSLPYDIIDKVEMIDDYGDAARLTGVRSRAPEKIMNITLRKDKSNGFTGIAEVGGGNANQYISDFTDNLFKGARKLSLSAAANNNNGYGNDYTQWLGLSYADAWGHAWSGSGNGNIFADNPLFSNSITQGSHFTTGSIQLQQENASVVHSQNQHADYELLFAPDANHRLRINSSFNRKSSDESDKVNIASTETDSGFAKQTQSNSLNQLTSQEVKSETRLYYGQSLPHSGQRMSLDAFFLTDQSRQQGDYLTQSQVASDSITTSIQQHYKVSNTGKGWDAGAAFHYYFPMGAGGFWESSYGFHATENRSERNWQQPASAGDSWMTVDSLSNDFTFRTLVQDLHGGYSRHSSTTDLEIGLTAAPGTLTGLSSGEGNGSPYHYFNLLPAGAFTYSLNKTSKMSLDYGSAVTTPTLQQVQPVTDLSNPQYPVTGNPDLKPSLTQSIVLNYEQNDLQPTRYHGFGIGVGYSTTHNQIIADVVQPHDTSTVIQQTYFTNVNGTQVFHLDGRFEFPPFLDNHLKISGWGLVNRTRSVLMANYIASTTNTLSYSQSITINYSMADRFEFKGSTGYDHSLTEYVSGGGAPFRTSVLNWRVESYLYLFREWKLSCILLQKFTGVAGSGLQTTPMYTVATLQRSFLKKRQLSCSLVAGNLLNVNAGFDQSSTPNTFTQTRSSILGRTFLLSFRWMFEKFR